MRQLGAAGEDFVLGRRPVATNGSRARLGGRGGPGSRTWSLWLPAADEARFPVGAASSGRPRVGLARSPR